MTKNLFVALGTRVSDPYWGIVFPEPLGLMLYVHILLDEEVIRTTFGVLPPIGGFELQTKVSTILDREVEGAVHQSWS